MLNQRPNSQSQPESEAPLVERRYTAKDRAEIPERTPSRFTYKAQRCHKHVKDANAKRGTDYNPYAVCTTSIGYTGSYKPGSRRKGRSREAAIVEAGTGRLFESVADLVKRFGIEHREHPPHQRQRARPEELRRMPKSIGYSPRNAKWYGWSHRAVAGFGVGSKVKKGDVLCKGVDEYGIAGGPYDEGYTARTLDDAKTMAANFAAQVA
jgi:hypothetical protein